MFEREFNKLYELKNKVLFSGKLKNDIERGVVFPALRKNYLNFYHKGQRLFTFKNNFETHIKFASVIDSRRGYIKEEDLKEAKKLESFADGYEKIKKNCALYPGLEAQGVSDIYSKYSYANKDNSGEICVLDIEICFESDKEENNEKKEEFKKKKLDRIDLLLFNKEKRILRFYEAKHYSNNEIRSRSEAPDIIKQINSYEKQLKKEAEILPQYERYIKVINELFGLQLPFPQKIDESVVLFVFGFDNQQKKQLATELEKIKSIKHYACGSTENLKIKNMWQNLNNL